MPNVKDVRARMQKLHAVQQTQDRAVCLLALSACTTDQEQSASLHEQSLVIKRHADNMAKAYYEQYPNCLSRNVHPWAK